MSALPPIADIARHGWHVRYVPIGNIAPAARVANIALNDVMILPYDANPGRMEFSEWTGVRRHRVRFPRPVLDRPRPLQEQTACIGVISHQKPHFGGDSCTRRYVVSPLLLGSRHRYSS